MNQNSKRVRVLNHWEATHSTIRAGGVSSLFAVLVLLAFGAGWFRNLTEDSLLSYYVALAVVGLMAGLLNGVFYDDSWRKSMVRSRSNPRYILMGALAGAILAIILVAIQIVFSRIVEGSLLAELPTLGVNGNPTFLLLADMAVCVLTATLGGIAWHALDPSAVRANIQRRGGSGT